MNKEDYFLASMRAECFRHKAWVLRAFAVSRLKPVEDAGEPKYPYELFSDGRYYCFKDPSTGMVTRIEGGAIDEPLFDYRRGITLKVGDVPSLDKETRVSYGTLLFNYVSLISTVGAKIPFQVGKCNVAAIEKLILAKLVDDVADGEKEEDDKIYVRELLKYIQHTVEISGYSQLCVPSATERSLRPAPGYKEVYTRLLLENKDRLNDPTVIAKIGDVLEQMDREWIAGDPDKGFYQNDKSFQVIRKKMFYMFGVEKNFADDGFSFIPQSLEEGWNLDYFPQMMNSTRDGSFSRGAMTALGGEKTKTIFRVMSGTQIAIPDCSATLGIPAMVTKNYAPRIVGRSMIIGGKTVKVTADNVNEFVGKFGLLRDPGYCLGPTPHFCSVCCGDFFNDKEASPPSAGAAVGSNLMNMMMKAMHGKALKTTRFELTALLM